MQGCCSVLIQQTTKFGAAACRRSPPHRQIDRVRHESDSSVEHDDLSATRMEAARGHNRVGGVTGSAILSFLPGIKVTAELTAGNNRETSTPRMAMTTNSSTSVKPRGRPLLVMFVLPS
jgi:hypothetical protein